VYPNQAQASVLCSSLPLFKQSMLCVGVIHCGFILFTVGGNDRVPITEAGNAPSLRFTALTFDIDNTHCLECFNGNTRWSTRFCDHGGTSKCHFSDFKLHNDQP
jgi:hypothetical protein